MRFSYEVEDGEDAILKSYVRLIEFVCPLGQSLVLGNDFTMYTISANLVLEHSKL